MQCQEMNCKNPVEEGYAICKYCLKAKGQGRTEPPKEPPTFHVKGEKTTYQPETIIVAPETHPPYEPPTLTQVGYLDGAVEQANEMMVCVKLCEELGLIPAGDPRATLLRYVRGLEQHLRDAETNFHTAAVELEDLRQKTEGATKEVTPPAELEPTRVPTDSTRQPLATQESVDLLARHVAQISLDIGGLQGMVGDIRHRVAEIASHLGVRR